MAIFLSPYLKGKGPRLKIDLDEGIMVAYPGKGKKPIRVFMWDTRHYRPGIGVHTEIQEVEDVLGFATAYVERPEEFDRGRWEFEQTHKKWWRQHGEAMEAEAYFRAEKVGRR